MIWVVWLRVISSIMLVSSGRGIGSIKGLVLGVICMCIRVFLLVGLWNASGVDGLVVGCFR